MTRCLKYTRKKCFQSKKDKEKFQENCYNCNQQSYIAKNYQKLKKQAIITTKISRNQQLLTTVNITKSSQKDRNQHKYNCLS